MKFKNLSGKKYMNDQAYGTNIFDITDVPFQGGV